MAQAAGSRPDAARTVDSRARTAVGVPHPFRAKAVGPWGHPLLRVGRSECRTRVRFGRRVGSAGIVEPPSSAKNKPTRLARLSVELELTTASDSTHSRRQGTTRVWGRP